MKQYEMFELQFPCAEPEGSQSRISLYAEFIHRESGKKTEVKGFYAGGGYCRIRFLPLEAGEYACRVRGIVQTEEILFTAEQAAEGNHGPVHAEGIHLYYADGTPFHSFGTTVYALANQEKELVDQTIDTLSKAPFNKVRMCVFPKHYDYNHNEPPLYAFAKRADGSWDVDRPNFAFWDAFEYRLKQLLDLGIQVDLILFHPYDRWGFASMPQMDNMIYLDYVIRRFGSFPNIWWSLANEYDLCAAKTDEDWFEFEGYLSANEPYKHMLSNHNCFKPYDWSRPNVTHASWQSKQLHRVREFQQALNKPVLIDECCYEGNLQHQWGNISGREMTARFWRTTVCGGYCTHGETFIDPDNLDVNDSIVWWARGGKLIGESPARIAYLKELVESLPAPLEPYTTGFLSLYAADEKSAEEFREKADNFFINALFRYSPAERDRHIASEYQYAGHIGEKVYLYYLDKCSPVIYDITLPEDKTYRIDVIDTWEMTRKTVMSGESGKVRVRMPGKEAMAILAVAE